MKPQALHLCESCQEIQAGILESISTAVQWHRWVEQLLINAGESSDSGSAQDAVQRLKGRILALDSQTSMTPFVERMGEALEDVMACLNEGKVGRDGSGTGTGARTRQDAVMQEAARCLRVMPDEMNRLHDILNEASALLEGLLGEAHSSNFEGGLCLQHAASLDAVAEALGLLEVLVNKVIDVDRGMTMEEIEAVEGILDVLKVG